MGSSTVLPLADILVLDFSQFLAGPVAALRLADLGARVVKVERPGSGEIGRTLAFAGRTADGDTLSFHAMNRNKEGLTADLKDPTDFARIRRLVASADVMIQNFRPGVMTRIGLDFESVRAINPGIVYASASGYGDSGPWRRRPGQDLLAQAVAGLPWLNGKGDRPVPVGLSLADHLMSCHLAQGVAALLVRRFRTGRGGLVETSLLEGLLDLQRDQLAALLNPGTNRSGSSLQTGGIFATTDGHLAVAATDPDAVAVAVGVDDADRVAARLSTRSTEHWTHVLDAAGVASAPLFGLDDLVAHDGFEAVQMTQEVRRPGSLTHTGETLGLVTTTSPLRLDGRRPTSDRAAPRLGQHNLLLDHSGALADP